MTKAKNKTQETAASVDDFLNSLDNQKKRADCFQLKSWMETLSGEPAKMWGKAIIGFGSYHFKYESGREGDFMKIGFSPRAQNLSIYIIPGFERYTELLEIIGKYKTGKSCLYVKKLEDIDSDILQELITESFNYMTKKYG